MAKELPYFKFEPNQWENGNIQILSREDKGLFIDLCSVYWSRLGDVPFKLAINKLCGGNQEGLKSLCDENIIAVEDNNIYISFLDEQLADFAIKSKNNSDNASLRWDKTPERISGNIVYVIRCWDDKEEFLKIGITKTSINRRFSGKLPYNFEAIIIDEYDNIELESHYSQIAKDCEYIANKNFSGYLECYSVSILPKLIDFANIRNAKYVRKQSESDAIREDKIIEDEIKEDNINKKIVFNFRKSLIDYGFKENLVIDWLKVRKTKKASNTETAFNSFINEIEKRNCNLNEILEYIVTKSWSGFKWAWYDTEKEKEKNDAPKKEKENAGTLIMKKYGLS